MSSRDVGTSGDRRGGPRVAQAQRPPAAVGGRAEDRVDGAAVQGPGGLGEQGRLDLRGVHPDLQHRAAGQQAGGGAVGGRDAVPQVRAPLDAGCDAAQRGGELGRANRRGQPSRHGDEHPAARHGTRRVEGVQQRGRGEIGGLGGGSGVGTAAS